MSLHSEQFSIKSYPVHKNVQFIPLITGQLSVPPSTNDFFSVSKMKRLLGVELADAFVLQAWVEPLRGVSFVFWRALAAAERR